MFEDVNGLANGIP